MTTTRHPAAPADPGRFPEFDGTRVRAIRVGEGLSAPALLELIRETGHRMGLSGLTRIERGGRTSPASARAIAAALNRPLTAFAPEPAPGTDAGTTQETT